VVTVMSVMEVTTSAVIVLMNVVTGVTSAMMGAVLTMMTPP